MTFGEKLQAVRESRNLSKMELAGLSDLSERTIYAYEKGARTPRFKNMEKIAKGLEIPLESLLDDSIEDPKSYIRDQRFIQMAREKYGYRGKRDAEELINDVTVLFAGGSVDEEAAQVVIECLESFFFHAKEEARRRFTPKKYRKESDERIPQLALVNGVTRYDENRLCH